MGDPQSWHRVLSDHGTGSDVLCFYTDLSHHAPFRGQSLADVAEDLDTYSTRSLYTVMSAGYVRRNGVSHGLRPWSSLAVKLRGIRFGTCCRETKRFFSPVHNFNPPRRKKSPSSTVWGSCFWHISWIKIFQPRWWVKLGIMSFVVRFALGQCLVYQPWNIYIQGTWKLYPCSSVFFAHNDSRTCQGGEC
jgi:hypothetical protein